MTSFLSLIFGGMDNHNSATGKDSRRRKRNRTARIEELESREMLSVDMIGFDVLPNDHLDDSAVIESFAGHSEGVMAFAPAAAPVATEANARDIAVYNDLLAKGVADKDFTWNSEGRLTGITANGCGLTGTLNLSGLDALQQLSCTYNEGLTVLDISGCTALQSLSCQGNSLIALNVAGLTNLTYLDCYGNGLWALTGLDGLSALTHLDCSSNNLPALNVAGLTNLTYLDCSSNGMTGQLNLTGLNKLVHLNCSNNKLTGVLDVTGTSLTYLDCSSNNQMTLTGETGTARGITTLEYLNCSNTKQATLNVRGNVNLKYLDVSDCKELTSLSVIVGGTGQLEELYVSGCEKLTSLNCSNNQLATLDVSGCTKLETLYCQDNELTKLDVSGCTKLKTLGCWNNSLTELNVFGCKDLQILNCKNNELTTLNVSGCSSLFELGLDDNPLKTLNVSGTALERLWLFADYGITTLTSLIANNCKMLKEGVNTTGNKDLLFLDVTDCEALRWLKCPDGKLSTLDVSGCKELRELDCSNNLLTLLDVSDCVELTETGLCINGNLLEYLDVSGTKLKTLVLSTYGITTLKELFAKGCEQLEGINTTGNNGLEILDVADCPNLGWLICPGGKLTTLNVVDCEELEILDCSNNQLTSLDVSDCTKLKTLNCSNNQLAKFSALTLPSPSPITDVDYSNQKVGKFGIPGTIANDKPLDLSDENIGGKTTYTWYRGTTILTKGTDYTEANGIFTFTGLNDGDVIYCVMTNTNYPGMQLYTTDVKVTNQPSVDAPDLKADNGGGVPGTVTKGDTFSVTTGNIKNDGNKASGDYSVIFYASTSIETLFTSGNLLGEVLKDSLGVGATTTVTLENISTALLEAGEEYYIGWKIVDVVGETNFSNNTGFCDMPLEVQHGEIDPPKTAPGFIDTELGADKQSVELKWNEVANAGWYKLEYTTTPGVASSWTAIGGKIDGTSFEHKNLAPGTYYYRVSAVNEAGTSDASEPESTIVPSSSTTVDPPTNVAGSVSLDNKATITWTAANGAEEYYVYRSHDGGKTWKRIGEDERITETTYTDVRGSNDYNSYQYRVTAVQTALKIESRPSAPTVTVRPKGTDNPPEKLGKFKVKKTVLTGDIARLTFKCNDKITSYEIRCSDSVHIDEFSEIKLKKGKKGLTVAISGLTPGESYTFAIDCYNGDKYLGTKNVTIKIKAKVDKLPSLNPTPSLGSNNVTFNWTNPNTSQWSKRFSITGYEVVCYDSSGSEVGRVSVDATAMPTATVTGLTANTEYTFEIIAKLTLKGKTNLSGKPVVVGAMLECGKVKTTV